MPDVDEFIPRSPVHPMPDLPGAAKAKVDPTCSAILEAVDELRRLDGRLAAIVEPLPASNGEFSHLSEIRGAVEVVRADLLADALDTLLAVANGDVAELRRRFEQRHQWLEGE
jgi:hypothetical protein